VASLTSSRQPQGALSIYYDNLLNYAIENILREVDEEGLEVPMVVTGGTSPPDGIEALFEDRLGEACIPFSISGVSRASDPMYSVARGAFVAARSEEDRAQAEEEEEAAEATADD